MIIYYCDHGHSTNGEVRLLPTNEGNLHGNIICCKLHFEKEMAFRRIMNNKYENLYITDIKWEDLKVYKHGE
jgi:hypothetical protein